MKINKILLDEAVLNLHKLMRVEKSRTIGSSIRIEADKAIVTDGRIMVRCKHANPDTRSVNEAFVPIHIAIDDIKKLQKTMYKKDRIMVSDGGPTENKKEYDKPIALRVIPKDVKDKDVLNSQVWHGACKMDTNPKTEYISEDMINGVWDKAMTGHKEVGVVRLGVDYLRRIAAYADQLMKPAKFVTFHVLEGRDAPVRFTFHEDKWSETADRAEGILMPILLTEDYMKRDKVVVLGEVLYQLLKKEILELYNEPRTWNEETILKFQKEHHLDDKTMARVTDKAMEEWTDERNKD